MIKETFRSAMSKDPGSSEIGEVFQEAYECEVITWKISNVSSLEIPESTEIRSPSFSYEKATWVLKMFPFVDSYFPKKFCMKVHLERLDSEIPVHNFFFKCFFKQQNAEVNLYSYYNSVKFISITKEDKILGCYEITWYDMFYHQRSYRWNDTITFVVEILAKKNTTSGMDIERNFFDTAVGPKLDNSSNPLKEIGEIVMESFNVNSIAWKIPNVPDIPVEVDNKVQSPTFSFAGVSWILKLFLSGQTKFKSEDVDVVIERLPCLIEKHALSYEIFFKSYDENEPITKDYFRDIICFLKRTTSFIFDSDNVQENVLHILSYKEFLHYATSSRQFGTVVLMCEFRMLKETEIKLGLQTESLQSFKELLPLKTENIEKAEIGEIIKKPFECDVISWTIPSFSSLLTAESDSVSSPQFSYKGATWILEMHRPSHAKDFTEVIMKRLNSQFPVHDFFCRSFFEVNGDEHFSLKTNMSFISFDSNVKQGHRIWSYDSENSYLYKNCRCNDTLTLVCELYTEKNSVIEMDFKAKSFRAASGNTNTQRDPKCVGELSIESFDVEMIRWKISKARSLPREVDYGVQSPSFPFAGAFWILEMFPYGQKKFESERNVDLVIKRMFSLFPKHSVSYRMYFEVGDKKFDEKGSSLKDFGTMLDSNIRGSFIFQSNTAKENVCCFESYANFFDLVEPTRSSDTVFLVCDFRIHNSDWSKTNIQKNLAKLSIGSSEQKFEKTAALVASSSKGSSGQKFEQTAVLLASSSKVSESSEQKSEQTAASLASSSNGSSEQKSEQTAALLASSSNDSSEKVQQFSGSYFADFKGCGNIPRESVDLPNKKLLQDLKDLFLNQEDCDVVLNVKGQQFEAHRLILKARSSVFASTFRNDMKEKATGVVDIEDCDPSSFSEFLYFLYCASTEKLSSENVFSLFTTADKYDVQDLRSECLKFMRKNLSVDTFCDTIALALQHSERELIELTTNFFSKNLQKIILTVKWQSFLVKNPIQGNELLIKALAPNK